MKDFKNLTEEELKKETNYFNILQIVIEILNRVKKGDFIPLKGTGDTPATGDIEIQAEENSEKSLTFSTRGVMGITTNPKFKIGRVVNGGINEPKLRVLFQDDTTYVAETACWEVEPSGTMASLRQLIGSHIEAFIGTEEKPMFRIASFIKDNNNTTRFEFGSGGTNETDIFLERWNEYSFAVVFGGSPKVIFYPDSLLRQPGVVDAFQQTNIGNVVTNPTPDVRKLFYRESKGLVQKDEDGMEHLLTNSYGDVKKSYILSDHNGWIKLDGRAVSTLSASQQTKLSSFGITGNLPNNTLEYIYLGL